MQIEKKKVAEKMHKKGKLTKAQVFRKLKSYCIEMDLKHIIAEMKERRKKHSTKLRGKFGNATPTSRTKIWSYRKDTRSNKDDY